MWDMAHPVGSIMQVSGGFDPNDVRGEWERVEGRFLLAASSAYADGSTGGEATHKLTVSEMPSHAHSSNVWGYVSGTEYGYITNNAGSNISFTKWDTSKVGGSAAHNNMPPYLAVNTWRRVA